MKKNKATLSFFFLQVMLGICLSYNASSQTCQNIYVSASGGGTGFTSSSSAISMSLV